MRSFNNQKYVNQSEQDATKRYVMPPNSFKLEHHITKDVPMLKPLFKGAIERPVTLVESIANLTPSLGFTLYGDTKRERPAVLEITRLDVGRGRSVINSFDKDRTLATWTREEQDDFFAEAFRTGVRGRFKTERRGQQASVMAATNLLLAGMSQTIAENGLGIVDGRSQFGSKEIGAEWFSEALTLGFNKTAAFINDSFNGMTHGSLQTGLEGAAEAITAFQKANKDRPADRFYIISNVLQGATQSLMDTAKTHQEFARLWTNEAKELKDIWEYHRTSMVSPELLMVEPISQIISGELDPHRDRHDFSGSFPVIGHWYSNPSHCKATFNHPADAMRYGFEYGPPAYRQYQAIMDNLKHRESLAVPRFADKDKGFMRGTPIDLPAELAQKRLDALEKHGKENRFIHSAIELRAIITAAKTNQPVDATLFQPASLQLRPQDHYTQTASLKNIERLAKKQGSKASNEDLSPGQRLVARLRHGEATYYLANHRHAQPSKTHEHALHGAALAASAMAGTDWEAAKDRMENELNQEIPMTHKPEVTEQPVNTRLELAYRSASLKAHETVILPGAITQKQIDQITSGLIDGDQIIAYQANLPTPLENYLEAEQIDIAPEDHVLTDLADWEDGKPEPAALHTTEKPTHEMDIGALCDKIAKIGPNGWDTAQEMERLDIPDDNLNDSLSL